MRDSWLWFAWHAHWAKPELRQRRPPINRQDIQHQAGRCWLGILEEGQTIFWSDAQRVGNVDNVEGGQLTQAELGAGAVTDGDIDDAITQRRDRGIRTTGRRVGEGAANNLLGLGVQDGKTPRPESSASRNMARYSRRQGPALGVEAS